MLQDLWIIAEPHLLELFGALVTLAITWVSVTVKAKFGLDIDARHREALHRALMSGAQLALEGELTDEAAKRAVVDYARESVPAALRHFAAPDGFLMKMAEAKITEVLLSIKTEDR